jgi:hypothetical protein
VPIIPPDATSKTAQQQAPAPRTQVKQKQTPPVKGLGNNATNHLKPQRHQHNHKPAPFVQVDNLSNTLAASWPPVTLHM